MDVIPEAREKYQLEVHAYCLMNNHYHLLIRTPQSNLSAIMKYINGVYTQRSNILKILIFIKKKLMIPIQNIGHIISLHMRHIFFYTYCLFYK